MLDNKEAPCFQNVLNLPASTNTNENIPDKERPQLHVHHRWKEDHSSKDDTMYLLGSG